MAARLLASSAPKPAFRIYQYSQPLHKPTTAFAPSLLHRSTIIKTSRKTCFTLCVIMDDQKQSSQLGNLVDEGPDGINYQIPSVRAAERLARKKSERFTYLVAAVMSSFGITSMAVMAVYYRFSWQMEGGEVPLSEMFGTFALSVGAAVGMEFWARWAHKALWHASLWHMHESHHRPREGPFELNDVFAIINAVPAIGLLSYGFFHKGLVPGLCFGACLAWPTCLSTMVWYIKDSQWGPLPTSPILEGLLLHTSFITQTSSKVCHMVCFWDPRNWKKWEAWKSWRRR
ncbi:hypothetical protein I3843_05G234600 [Carya illinoinensis]|uniref:beta-carotene 3-hydroxylase n=1 Tax=Carya illinoinensis TaxID=32201 RepID=A0A922F8X9_CARIL|nr:hypothetical protein I3842_05G255700 [Carya illinoinensis]KAG7981444.1 hypothetical protein I3843_05G234600 [Carya illinoinensis]